MNRVQQALTTAEKYVGEYWPLPSFIATNPLWQSVDKPFHQVVGTVEASHKRLLAGDALLYSQQIDSHYQTEEYVKLKQRVFEFCAAIFSKAKHLPRSKQVNIKAFVELKKARKNFRQRYTDNDKTIILEAMLQQLHVPASLYESYILQIIFSVYGYASLCCWMQAHRDNPWLSFEFELIDLLIIWLYYESRLRKKYPSFQWQHSVSAPIPQSFLQVGQAQEEQVYREQLLAKLAQAETNESKHPAVQAVFCIDTRSELLRRALEKKQDIQTFGFAGFFGFIFSLSQGDKVTHQCPALVEPSFHVTVKQQRVAGYQSRRVFFRALNYVKGKLLASYSLFESYGLWFAIPYLGKTFMPTLWGRISKKLRRAQLLRRTYIIDTPINEALVDAAEQMLTTLGLTEHFAEKIVLCAHQSKSENNPFASSLDCGACGGNAGISNTIVACQILNDAKLRQGLQARGITVPVKTKFIPACHTTSFDSIDFYSDEPELEKRFNEACQLVIAEKVERFPMLNHLERQRYDWAELIPEYGLLNNAAMIIAPRHLTASINLEGRAFLHDYQEKLDVNGDILESILLAPMIVAHWINMQYYFSTALPELFGAGNKALHNILPGIGVMEGNISDLKIGLPRQSVIFRGQKLHTSQRLLVVIAASHKRVTELVQKHVLLQHLIGNQWLSIVTLNENQSRNVEIKT